MFQTFLTVYAISALAGSALLLFAVWHGRSAARREPWPTLTGPAAGDPFAPNGPADVGAALTVALNRIAVPLTESGARVDVAIRPGLRARMTGQDLADLLEDVFRLMLRRSAGRLLLTATPRGSAVIIRLTDDAPSGGAGPLHGALRPIIEQVALRGATLAVTGAAGGGATVTLRLAAVADGERALAADAPMQAPAPAAGVV